MSYSCDVCASCVPVRQVTSWVIYTKVLWFNVWSKQTYRMRGQNSRQSQDSICHGIRKRDLWAANHSKIVVKSVRNECKSDLRREPFVAEWRSSNWPLIQKLLIQYWPYPAHQWDRSFCARRKTSAPGQIATEVCKMESYSALGCDQHSNLIMLLLCVTVDVLRIFGVRPVLCFCDYRHCAHKNAPWTRTWIKIFVAKLQLNFEESALGALRLQTALQGEMWALHFHFTRRCENHKCNGRITVLLCIITSSKWYGRY